MPRPISFILPSSCFGKQGQGSNVLQLVNGRPVLTWIIQDLLKNTKDTIFVLYEGEDNIINKFIMEHYPVNSRVLSSSYRDLRDVVKIIETKSKFYKSSFVRILRNDLFIVNSSYELKEKIFINDKRIIGKFQFSTQNIEFLDKWIGKYEADKDNERNEIVDGRYWVDFSEKYGLETARTKLIESRSFNSLRIHPLYPEIIKSSSNREKLQNEVFWYRELPSRFKSLTPQVFGHDENGIRMEYYGYGTLTEKFLYGNLSIDQWKGILQRLFNIVRSFSEVEFKADNTIFHIFYSSKLNRRLKDIELIESLKVLVLSETLKINNQTYDGLPKLLPKIRNSIAHIATTSHGTVCHGDMCFNNILYDLPTGIVKLIDPRGNIEGIPSIICDPRYDIAKIRHSFCGNYDGIVEGYYSVIENCEKGETEYLFETSLDKTLIQREQLFDSICIENGFDVDQIRMIEAYLFLTMIPLHRDSVNKMKSFLITSIIKFNKVFCGE